MDAFSSNNIIQLASRGSIPVPATGAAQNPLRAVGESKTQTLDTFRRSKANEYYQEGQNLAISEAIGFACLPSIAEQTRIHQLIGEIEQLPGKSDLHDLRFRRLLQLPSDIELTGRALQDGSDLLANRLGGHLSYLQWTSTTHQQDAYSYRCCLFVLETPQEGFVPTTAAVAKTPQNALLAAYLARESLVAS